MTVFAIQSVVSVGPAAVRVVFSAAAKAISADGSDDALNPANYQLAGSTVSRIIKVSAVSDNPQAFTLYGSALIGVGSWSLLVSGVVADDGTPMSTSNVGVFSVGSSGSQDLVNGGADDVTPQSVLRQFLSPAFVGEGWESVVYALSRGDQYLQDTARGAWDQMFLSTAEGRYLDRLAGEFGVSRPDGVGMSDAVFRELAVRLSTEKVTYKALWQLLEVFYGRAAVRAMVETEVDAPYDLADGSQVLIEVDGTSYPINFYSADFSDINQAQAIEVAATITRQLRNLDSQAWAVAALNTLTGLYRVRVYSPTLGLASRIRVTGGLAQYALRFPTLIATPAVGSTYSVTVTSNGRAAFAFTNVTASLLAVREGDYLLAQDSELNAANKGTFEIESVTATWTGSAFVETVTVLNTGSVTQSGPLTANAGDFACYRPTYSAPSSNGAMVSGADGSIRLHLPTTTEVVAREPLRAAYIPQETEYGFDLALAMGPDGILQATSDVAHGLSANDWIDIRDAKPTSYTHSTTSSGSVGSVGTTGQTAASRQSLTASMRAVDVLGALYGHTMTAMDNGEILIHGGRIGVTFSSAFEVLRVTGVANDSANRPVYSYNYFAGTGSSFAAASGAASSYRGAAGIGVLLACGQITSGGATTASCRFFASSSGGASAGQMLTVTNAVHPACSSLLALTILDSSSREQVLLIGGTGATFFKDISAFNPATNGFSIFAKALDPDFRAFHAGCSMTDPNAPTRKTAAVWCGGQSGSDVLDSTVFFSELVTTPWAPVVSTPTSAGRMAIARYDHRLIEVGNGRFLVIGGIGRSLSRETVNRRIHEVEMFDVATGVWTPAGRLRVGRSSPNVFKIGDNVYVYGGMPSSGVSTLATTLPIEVYNIATGRWSVLPVFPTGYRESNGMALSNGAAFFFGGVSLTTATNITSAFVEGSNYNAPAHSVNGLRKVTSTPTPTTFTISGLPTGDILTSSLGQATLAPNTVTTQDRAIGPYVWNEDGDPVLTGIEDQIVGDISQYAQVGTLTLTDATSFPDEPGWLAFKAGYADAVYPVPYSARISDTQLALDFTYRFPFAVSSGTTVTLLAQKAPGAPSDAKTRGSFYVTNSNAGRVAAEEAIRSAVAAGPDLNVKVLYPSDVGLGNAGYPTVGNQKLSDAVRVWGGDRLSAEVAAAQEEDDIV